MAPALATLSGLASWMGVGVRNATLSPDCHPLGLSHRRKLFCLQASFAKEEKVVRKVLWKVQHVLEAKCSSDPGSERRLTFFLNHAYTPSGQISKCPSRAIRNPETCMYLAQIHFSLLK